MFRGRVGYDSVGNRSLREHEKEKRRKVHLTRISKIKHRKAGSGTLDNNLPRSMSSLGVISANPRKKQVREEEYRKIERQNKILLQRMAKIIEGPITYGETSSYQTMFSTIRNPNAEIEKERIKRCNKALFDNISKTKPYYCAKEWEDDYKRLLKWHKFMRQVVYVPKPDEPHNDDENDTEIEEQAPSKEELHKLLSNSLLIENGEVIPSNDSLNVKKPKLFKQHSRSRNPSSSVDSGFIADAESSSRVFSSSHMSKLRKIRNTRDSEALQLKEVDPTDHDSEERDDRKASPIAKLHRLFKSRATDWDENRRLLSKESRYVKITVWSSDNVIDMIIQSLDSINREYTCSHLTKDMQMLQYYVYSDLACISQENDNLMICVDLVEGPFSLHSDVTWDRRKVHRVLPELSAMADTQQIHQDNRNDMNSDSLCSPIAAESQMKQNIGLREIGRVSLRLAEVFLTTQDFPVEEGEKSISHLTKHSRFEIINHERNQREDANSCFEANSCVLLGDIDVLTFSLAMETQSSPEKEEKVSFEKDGTSKTYLKKIEVKYTFSKKEDSNNESEARKQSIPHPSKPRSRSWSNTASVSTRTNSSRNSVFINSDSSNDRPGGKDNEERWIDLQPKFVYCAVRCRAIGHTNMTIDVTCLSQGNLLTMACLNASIELPTVSSMDRDSCIEFFDNVVSSANIQVFNRIKFTLAL